METQQGSNPIPPHTDESLKKEAREVRPGNTPKDEENPNDGRSGQRPEEQGAS